MIEIKDVTILKIPYPNASSALFNIPHMYICTDIRKDVAYILKCQSYKPYHKNKDSLPKSRLVENPDKGRNPFIRATIIDLDKIFSASKHLNFPLIDPISEDLLLLIRSKLPPDTQIIPIIPDGI